MATPILQRSFNNLNNAGKGFNSAYMKTAADARNSQAAKQARQNQVVGGATSALATGLAIGGPAGAGVGAAIFAGSLLF